MLLGLALLLLSAKSCEDKPTKDELKQFAATEVYPNDTFLDMVSNKRALIIVAHDDDDCAMSGTISKLTANGWNIKQLSLISHNNPKTGKNPAFLICNGNEKILADGSYRLGMDTMKQSYVPISLEEIKKQFLREKVASALTKKINDFDPSVVFTLDNIKGAYGHPDHIFISQLVVDLFKERQIKIQKIYQSVYPDHMEEEIVDKRLGPKMKKWGYPDPSKIANEIYGIEGMPEPNVQIDISKYGETKMQYLRAYPEKAKKNMRKFIPYYESFDAEEYFSIFNREFFRVIE